MTVVRGVARSAVRSVVRSLTDGIGGEGGGSPVVYSDDFNRADEDAEASPNWTPATGSTSRWEVASNQFTSNGASADSSTILSPISGASVYAECELGNVQADDFLIVRAIDDNNYAGVRPRTSSVQMFKRVGGSFSGLGTASGLTLSVSDVIRIETNDAGNVRFLLNGVEELGWTSLGGDLASAEGTGFVRLGTALIADNFEAGAL